MNETFGIPPNQHRNPLFIDEQADLIDDLAALCEHWKRNRESGRTPQAIRRAIVMVAKDLSVSTEPVTAFAHAESQPASVLSSLNSGG